MTTSDKFQRHSFKVAFKLTAKSVRSPIFDIWHFWKSYCWFRLMWGLDHRSRSRSRSRYILPGAGAGAGAAEQFYSEPEPEPECCPGAGAGADQKCHGPASLLSSPIFAPNFTNRTWRSWPNYSQGSCEWVDCGLEVLWVELKQILHLKFGCSDFGPVRDRGSGQFTLPIQTHPWNIYIWELRCTYR